MSSAKYTRVKKPLPPKTADVSANEFRITAKGNSKAYIASAVQRLTKPKVEADEEHEGANNLSVVLKGMGTAISKAVNIAEIVKRRVPGLHQHIDILSIELEDMYEPLEEGLEVIVKKRLVSSIVISLATSAEGLLATSPGDQVSTPNETSSVVRKKPQRRANKRPKKVSAAADADVEEDAMTAATSDDKTTSTRHKNRTRRWRSKKQTNGDGDAIGGAGDSASEVANAVVSAIAVSAMSGAVEGGSEHTQPLSL